MEKVTRRLGGVVGGREAVKTYCLCVDAVFVGEMIAVRQSVWVCLVVVLTGILTDGWTR